ncbi:MAG TPA: PKD domain-containing protein, partial [Cyclobacteriaceae bacterium]
DVTTNFGCTASIQKQITILESPDANFSFTTACANQPTTFTPTSSAGINSWQWKIGTATYNQQTPTHVFGSSNTFSAELTTIDNNGCVAVLSKQVSVPVPSIPNFNSANNCTQQNTIFTDLTPSGTDPVVSRAWQFGTLGTGTGPVASFMFPAAGSYPTKLTVTNESGCSYIISKNVSISNSPVPTFTATPQVGTVPLTVQLVNTSDNTVSQLWSVNDPQSSTSTDLSTQFSFSELGQYVVDLTVTNPEGCSATSSKIISVIVPSLDLELTSLSLNPSATGEINLLVSVKNNSNTPITNPKIAIDISGQVVVNETLNVVIQPTQTHTQVLTTGIIDAKGGMTYVCAELILDGDINNLNNKLCLNQESGTVVLDPYPNPGSEQMTIEWISESQGEVDIYIFDPVGRKVFDYSGSSFESGLNRIAIPLQGYNPGIYHVLFVSGSARKSFRYNVRR